MAVFDLLVGWGSLAVVIVTRGIGKRLAVPQRDMRDVWIRENTAPGTVQIQASVWHALKLKRHLCSYFANFGKKLKARVT